MKFVRSALILVHRYLGILLCLIFIMWFLSGIAMIYVRAMPNFSSSERLQRMPPLDFSRIHLRPAEAAERASIRDPASRLLLLTIEGRPAYRFSTPDFTTVFADNGEVMEPPGEPESLDIARRFLGSTAAPVQHLRVISSPDQWTIGNSRLMPMHKISVADPFHTQLYVSEATGEVAVMTTRQSRALAWISAIPHWMYFEALRSNGLLWTRVILWISGAGTILSVIGIILAIIQYSRRKPHIPYAGWMRWHYLTGVVFGVFTLTWVFSGFLSMEPWDWASEGGLGEGMSEAFSGGPLDLAAFPDVNEKNWSAIFRVVSPERIREVEFLRIQGAPYYVVRGSGFDPMLATAQPLEIRRELFSESSLIFKAKQANPDVTITEATELFNYDSYYYSRDGEAPLPVLRLKFDDPDKTWFYIDPKLSRVLARYQRRERLQRWIYHGLHSLDFSFWYYSRPAWDIGVIVLCAGGAVLSVIGIVISLRRVRRDLRRIVQH
jgi:hypothetical protein